jgi:hypothetical protein
MDAQKDRLGTIAKLIAAAIPQAPCTLIGMSRPLILRRQGRRTIHVHGDSQRVSGFRGVSVRSAPWPPCDERALRKYRKHGLARVPEDDRCAEADDVLAGAEAVDEESVQVLDRREADVDEEVVAAGEHEDCRVLPAEHSLPM